MSVVDQYSHLIDICQRSLCEVIFCFEKEVRSFYQNYSMRNSRNYYLSVK